MSSAADKIEDKEFGTAQRGYEPSEVRAFLRAVAAEYRKTASDIDGFRPARAIMVVA